MPRCSLPSRRRLPPSLCAGGSCPTRAAAGVGAGTGVGIANTCPGGNEEAARALKRCGRRLLPRHAHLLPCSWLGPSVRRTARRDAAPQAWNPGSERRRGSAGRAVPGGRTVLRCALPRRPGGAAARARRAGRRGLAGGWEPRGERTAAEARCLFNFALLRGEGAAALAPLPSAATFPLPGSGCSH